MRLHFWYCTPVFFPSILSESPAHFGTIPKTHSLTAIKFLKIRSRICFLYRYTGTNGVDRGGIRNKFLLGVEKKITNFYFFAGKNLNPSLGNILSTLRWGIKPTGVVAELFAVANIEFRPQPCRQLHAIWFRGNKIVSVNSCSTLCSKFCTQSDGDASFCIISIRVTISLWDRSQPASVNCETQSSDLINMIELFHRFAFLSYSKAEIASWFTAVCNESISANTLNAYVALRTKFNYVNRLIIDLSFLLILNIDV